MTEPAQIGGALPQGTWLGHCEIRSVLGRGGGGISYLAYDAHLEREVVIKEHFPPTLCYRLAGEADVRPVSGEGYERSLSSFCREARILAGLNHPGIVKVYDIFQAAGTACMVMEFVGGESLSEWLPRHAEDMRLVSDVLSRLLSALGYLHANEVLHRDIKPSNIIIRADAQPVLIDFGAAMLGTPPTTITLVGTPGYAAPEQFQPHGRVGPWSDLYALAHSFEKLIPASAMRRYSRSFVLALHKASQQDWKQRPASAAVWRRMLQKKRLNHINALGWCFLGGVVVAVCYCYCWPISAPQKNLSPGPLSVESPRNAQDENELQSVFNEPLLKDEEINRLNEGDPEQMREIFQTMKRRQKDRIQQAAERLKDLDAEGRKE